jgi:hypothetical protein
MSHFNHSFHKSFYIDRLVNNAAKKTQDLATDGNGTTLLGGIYKSTDYTNIPTGTALTTYAAATPAGAKQKFIIASESPRSSTIGGMSSTTGSGLTAVTWNSHGGYDESIKSKDIQMNFINALGRADAVVGTSQTFEFHAYGGASSTSCFPCGSDPMVRIDLKGSDALRMLGHNAYRQFDIGGVCNCCGDDGDYIDPVKALAMIAKNIADDPILSKLLNTSATADVQTTFFAYTTNGGAAWTEVAYADLDAVACAATWDANRGAVIRIKPGVVDTQFGNCSWDTRDFANYEPLLANVEVLDESGNACDICKATHNPLGAASYNNGAPTTLGQFYYNATDTTGVQFNAVVPVHDLGVGDKVFKDLILTDAYMQMPRNQGIKDSARFREIEQSDALLTNITAANRNYWYTIYYLTHSVPRYNNPTGVFDNDQYTYSVAVPKWSAAGATIAAGDLVINGSGDADFNSIWTALSTLSGATMVTPS